MLSHGFSLPYKFFGCVLWLSVFFIYRIPACVCMYTCVYLCLNISILLFLQPLSLCLLVLSYSDLFCFVLFYIIILIIPWMPTCFLMRNRDGVDMSWKGGVEELVVEGAEMVTRVYRMKRKSIFNERKIKFKKVTTTPKRIYVMCFFRDLGYLTQCGYFLAPVTYLQVS